jgi:hypothetical protein
MSRGQLPPSTVEALSAALAAEHAAIFGYGTVGAYLTSEAEAAARAAEAAHRDRRDVVSQRIAASNATPIAAAPAYSLPFPVTDAPSAIRLAAALEEGTAGAWREALAGTADEDRKLALEALIACAVQATRWRAMAGIVPVTLPFPGMTQ